MCCEQSSDSGGDFRNLRILAGRGGVQKWGFAAPASCLGQLLVARQARRYDEGGDGRARREVSVLAAEPLEGEELALSI